MSLVYAMLTLAATQHNALAHSYDNIEHKTNYKDLIVVDVYVMCDVLTLAALSITTASMTT
jgi:hypothetical protein